MDNYNGPDDYDGYLHDNKKEVIVNEEETDLLLYYQQNIDDYFDNVTDEQFLEDIIKAGGIPRTTTN